MEGFNVTIKVTIMEESAKKMRVEGGDKEILYSKSIKAGKRIYYLDVKRNLRDELFIAITESKKIQPRESEQAVFEKHKIFLYREDFNKFMSAMDDVIAYIDKRQSSVSLGEEDMEAASGKVKEEEEEPVTDEIKLDINF